MGRKEQITSERLRKLGELKQAGINPYPSRYDVTHYSKEILEKNKALKPGKSSKTVAKVAGRLMSSRKLGKIAFGVIQDGKGKIQVTLQKGKTPPKHFNLFKKYIDAGDFIGVEGPIQRTERGEISVLAKKLTLLSKSLFPLPEKWHGLQDEEERWRKRYLDIIMDPEVRERFVRKSKFWAVMRKFLVERDFLEVETPILENTAGGAAAEPFKTRHNSLDIDVFLRISMGELWQKRLMVAGYPRTFEIGRQFRNEGMDAEHLQDYAQMEFYMAYSDYNDGMALVEELYKKIAKDVFGKTKFKIGNHTVDFNKKWKKIDYSNTIKKETGVDVLTATGKEIELKLLKLGIEYTKGAPKPRLIDSLWKYCRRKVTGPVFLTGQLVEVTPLAKRDAKDPRKVQQFQIIIAGSEMGNGYSELNDPLDQEQRFKEQQELKDAGDVEAQMHDHDFVEALKYGMPPTCGFGVSERLFSFLENLPVREAVIFPLMKPASSENNGGKK